MKILFLAIFLLCTGNSMIVNINLKESRSSNNYSGYLIYKIDSVHNYYCIYAKRADTFYKIISVKEVIPNCNKIKIGKRYNLRLQAIFGGKFLGKDVSPSFWSQVDGYGLDDSTTILLEGD